MDKKIGLFVLLILMTSAVGAVDSSIEGEVEYSFHMRNGIDSNLIIGCFDQNNSYCAPQDTCQITIADPNGLPIYENASMDNKNTSFVFNITGDKITQNGAYYTMVNCNGNGTNALSTGYIFVSPNGFSTTTADSVLYIVVLVISVFIFILCLYGGLVIKFKNHRGEGGELLNINDMKYVKIFLLAVSYLLMVWISFIVYGITKNLFVFDMASGLFKFIFYSLLSGIFPVFVVGLIIVIINLMNDSKLRKDMERGFR